MQISKTAKYLLLAFSFLLPSFEALAEIPKTDYLERRLVYFPKQAQDWDRLKRQGSGKISPLIERIQTTIKSMDSDQNTIAYVLVHKDSIIAENYKFGANAQTPLYAYSVTKSAVGVMALLTMCDKGIAPTENLGAHSKRLKQTLWSEVSIQDTANMSSGVLTSWRSQYMVNHFMTMLERKSTPFEMLRELPKATGRNGTFHYSGYDTNALGIFIEDQNNQKLSQVFASRIWRKMATTNDGYWQVTKDKENVAAFGLMMTGRDWAQFGRYVSHLNETNNCFRLYLSNAVANRVRSAEGGNGYAFQFWLPNGSGSQVEMLGADGQRVFIDFEKEIVLFVYSIKDTKVGDKGWRVINSLFK